ncbi:hypothetical protein ACIF6H_36935 [Streptomyces microflavus]|nr:hypothetical protein OG728_00870 [Streptomyces microflavus]
MTEDRGAVGPYIGYDGLPEESEARFGPVRRSESLEEEGQAEAV